MQWAKSGTGRVELSEQGQVAGFVRSGHAHSARKRRLRIRVGAHTHGHPRLRGHAKDRSLLLAENRPVGFQKEEAHANRRGGGRRGSGRAGTHVCVQIGQRKGLQTFVEVCR